MTPARFRWGMLLILIGVLILLTNMDVLTGNYWEELIVFFPVLLIAIGIEKIFTKSRLQFISYLTSILIFAGALYAAFETSRLGEDTSFFSSRTIHERVRPSVKTIEAVLKLDDGDVTIRDATDDLLYGRFREFSFKPRYDFDIEDDLARVTLTGHSGRLLGGIVRVDTDEPDDWRLAFSRDIPLELGCYGDKSDIHLNLAATPLRRLRLEADDADIYIKLGNLEPEAQVYIIGYDSELRLRVPQESGLRVSGIDDDSFLSRVGLARQNGYFVNGGYDTLPSRIIVELEDRFRSFSIDFY
jgi:hypothetical protein